MLRSIGVVSALCLALAGVACGPSPPVSSKAMCQDGVKDGSETDIDCGGPCAPCAALLGCAQAADCAFDVCTGGKCQAPSCTDHVKNGAETGPDCGGACGLCPSGAGCASAKDCAS